MNYQVYKKETEGKPLKFKIEFAYQIIKFRTKFGLKKLWFAFLWIVLKFSYRFIEYARKFNQPYYDKQIVVLYQQTRIRQSFEFKEKIVSLGKGEEHVKMLLIETENGDMRVKLDRQDYPNLYSDTIKPKKNGTKAKK